MMIENQVSNHQRHKRFLWLKIGIACVALGLFIAAAIVWIINVNWSSYMTVIFAVLGVVLALFAWLFPISPDKPEQPKDIATAHASTTPPINITVSPNINVSPYQNVSSQSSPLAASDPPGFAATPLASISTTKRSGNSSMTDSEEATLDANEAQKREEIQHLPDPDTVFQFNVPLTDPTEYYGRANARATLISRTRKGASTSVVGPRRIGKSWLISYLRLVVSQEFGPNFRFGYLDATMPSSSTVAGFTSKVLEELGNIVLDRNIIGLDILEQVVRDLRLRNQVPVLCIDEFEGLCNQEEFGLTFFSGLRAITQTGLSLIVVSKQPIITMVSDQVKTSPFFNVFEQLTLKPFSSEEAEKFAREKSTLAGFTDQERTYLLEYGRKDGQQWPPLRLQLAGKMLLEDKNQAVREGAYIYRPNDLNYWRDFERRLEEKYQGVVGK